MRLERTLKRRGARSCPVRFGAYLFFIRPAPHTFPMDELERLRTLVGPEASQWTTAQLEQLQREIDVMAALLLDLYRSRKAERTAADCELPNFDVPQPDR
jgi:hypothetical protein